MHWKNNEINVKNPMHVLKPYRAVFGFIQEISFFFKKKQLFIYLAALSLGYDMQPVITNFPI